MTAVSTDDPTPGEPWSVVTTSVVLGSWSSLLLWLPWPFCVRALALAADW